MISLLKSTKICFLIGIVFEKIGKSKVFCTGTGAHKWPLRYIEKIPEVANDWCVTLSQSWPSFGTIPKLNLE